MSNIRFYVDHCDSNQITGWIDDNGPIASLRIEINERWICDLSPTQIRRDLREMGFGDGKRGFQFSLAGYDLKIGDSITLKAGNREIFTEVLIPKEGGIVASDPSPEMQKRLFEISQSRWKGDEATAGLTWGRIMDGSSLWDLYAKAHRFTSSDRIIEIGPGYGRLLQTALERKVPFASYIGVELSETRVKKLREQFPNMRVRFETGDVNNWKSEVKFDVVICSSTFEHLYPDCKAALTNLCDQLTPGAHVFIDFLPVTRASAVFEPNKAFVRVYTNEELLNIFRECGYQVIDIEHCALGEAVSGTVVNRNVVIAQQRRR